MPTKPAPNQETIFNRFSIAWYPAWLLWDRMALCRWSAKRFRQYERSVPSHQEGRGTSISFETTRRCWPRCGKDCHRLEQVAATSEEWTWVLIWLTSPRRG